MSDPQTLAPALAAAGQRMDQLGYCPATSGNLSARLHDRSVLITESGKHKGNLSVENFLPVSLAGESLDGRRPSAETLIHCLLYERFPQIGSVLHGHTPAAVVWTRSNNDIELTLDGFELQKAFAGTTTHNTTLRFPVFENNQSMPELTAQIAQRLEDDMAPGLILRGHGLYTWGDQVSDALRHLEALETLIDLTLRIKGHVA